MKQVFDCVPFRDGRSNTVTVACLETEREVKGECVLWTRVVVSGIFANVEKASFVLLFAACECCG